MRWLAAAKAGSGLFSVYDQTSGLKLAIQQTLSFTVHYNLSPLLVLLFDNNAEEEMLKAQVYS